MCSLILIPIKIKSLWKAKVQFSKIIQIFQAAT